LLTGDKPKIQRAGDGTLVVVYGDSRIIPFACTWMAHSTNNGTSWSAPRQLSTGERDAKQDSSAGSFNTGTRKGQVNISWQEDPQGLQLGEADGPGDGASGANVNGGTDVWYAWATIDLPDADKQNDFVLAAPSGVPGALGHRLTDNWEGLYGIGGQLNPNIQIAVFWSRKASTTRVVRPTSSFGAAWAVCSRPNWCRRSAHRAPRRSMPMRSA